MNKGDKAQYLSRREFLQRSSILIGGALLGSLTGCLSQGKTSVGPPASSIPGVIYSPDTLREQRLPPGQHEVTDWPVLQAGAVPHIGPETWTLRLFGLVPAEVNLSFADFSGLPQVEVYSDIHCVTHWSRLGNLWKGVGARQFIDIAHPQAQTKYVIVHAAGGFTSNIPLSEFAQDDVLLAVSNDSQPLIADHGAPVRLVVPRLYFWKSAKWVTGLEFTAEDHPGFWERAGYNNHGDPWTEERFQ